MEITRTSNGSAKFVGANGSVFYIANQNNIIVKEGHILNSQPMGRTSVIRISIPGVEDQVEIPMEDLSIAGATFLGSVADAIALLSNNILPAPSAAFTVQKLAQVITFTGPTTADVGDDPVTLAGASNSGLTVSYASSDPAVATVTGNILTIVGAGSANITASQAGDANYSAATPVVVALTVSA